MAAGTPLAILALTVAPVRSAAQDRNCSATSPVFDAFAPRCGLAIEVSFPLRLLKTNVCRRLAIPRSLIGRRTAAEAGDAGKAVLRHPQARPRGLHRVGHRLRPQFRQQILVVRAVVANGRPVRREGFAGADLAIPLQRWSAFGHSPPSQHADSFAPSRFRSFQQSDPASSDG